MSTTKTRYAVKSGSRESIMNTRNAIAERKNFATSGALRGERGNYVPTFHKLRGAARAKWEEQVNDICYVVYSYETPIAWYTPDGGWVVNLTRYSVTTRYHQNAVVHALGGHEIAYEIVEA